MKRFTILLLIIAAIGLITLTPVGSPVLAHEAPDGNARVEIVMDPLDPNQPWDYTAVEGRIERADPQIRVAGGLSWMAVSLVNPLLGDCHNGEISQQARRHVRAGWMSWDKADWGTDPYVMAAWINENSQYIAVKNIAVTGTTSYKTDAWRGKTQPQT
ncbi:MAG TPA: hypothetical protein VF707_20890, partial [Ardenticatenaceae bacterium]